MSEAQTAARNEAAVVAGRGALFIGFAKLYFMVSGALQQVLLPNLVGAIAFGAFSVVNNVISIVNNTMVQATVQAVSKFTAQDDAQAGAVQRAGLKMQLVLGVVLTLGLLLGAPLIARFEAAPQYTSYFRIAALIPLFYAIYAVYVGSANGLRRFHIQAAFDVSFSTIKTILLLGCAVLWGVSGAFMGFVAAAAVFPGSRGLKRTIQERLAKRIVTKRFRISRHQYDKDVVDMRAAAALAVARLGAGPYLFGRDLTIADIALASMCAPLVIDADLGKDPAVRALLAWAEPIVGSDVMDLYR